MKRFEIKLIIFFAASHCGNLFSRLIDLKRIYMINKNFIMQFNGMMKQ
jgi:hypothetical protein